MSVDLPPGVPSPVERLEVLRSLQEIYARFTEVTRRSGNEVRLVVADTVTYWPADFEKLALSELDGPEPGPTIVTSPGSRASDLPSQEEVTYQARWQEPHPSAAETYAAQQQAVAGMTFGQMLEYGRRERPDLVQPFDALTRYTVTATLAGRSRTYRATAYWQALDADTVRFGLNDFVVGSVSDAWEEDRPVRTVEEVFGPRFVAPEPETAEAPSCPLSPARVQELLAALPCQERSPGLWALDLRGQGEPSSLGAGAVPLRRLEPSSVTHQGQAVRYLMGEWALVEVSAVQGRGVAKVTSATVDEFAAGVVAGLGETLAERLTPSAKGEREALVVAVPLEEPASRRVPLPSVRLEALSVQVPASHRGRALLLVDFGENRALQKLTVLHGSAFVSRKLELHLERTLKLQAETAEPHRVAAFVLVDVGAKLEIVSQLRYLPRSCCGELFCQ